MWKYVRKYLYFAIPAALFMVGEVSMDLLQPGLMRRIVDEGVLGTANGGVGDLHLILTLGIRMIGLVLFGGLCGAFRAFPCICKITRPALCAFGSGSIAMNGANLLSANRQLAGKGDVDKFSGMLGVDEFFNFQ